MILAYHTIYHDPDVLRWLVECLSFFLIATLGGILWNRSKNLEWLI